MLFLFTISFLPAEREQHRHSAFQQALRISNLGATKEPNIDMSFEGIDIAECRITYARGRMVALAEHLHAPVVVTLKAKGCFPALV